jgi:hypothetical protein
MADDQPWSGSQLRDWLKTSESEKPKGASVSAGTTSEPFTGESLKSFVAPKTEPSVGVGEDVLRATGAGVGRGAVGLTGLPGDIEALGRYGIRKAGYDVGQETFLPTSEEMIKKAKSYIPGAKEALDYAPVHGPGRYARTAAEFLPGALAGPGGIGAKIAGSVGAGAASQGVEDIFKQTPSEGGALETALKIGASIPAYALGAKTISGIAKPFEGAISPTSAVEKRLASDIASDVRRGSMGADISALSSGEVPLAAAAGDRTRAAIQRASERAPEKSVGEFTVAAQRARESAPINVQTHIDEAFGGGKPVNPFGEEDRLRNAAREMNNENYKRVMALPEARQIGSPQLTAISRAIQQDGIFNQVAKNLQVQSAALGVSKDPASIGMIKTKQGWMPNPQGMPLEFWDSVKRELDDRIYSLKRGAPGPTTATDVRNYTSINNALKSNLDNVVGEYGAVRGAAAEAAGATNAIDLGMKYLTETNGRKRNDIEQAFRKLNDEQKASAAYGLAGAYRQRLEGKNPDLALKMFSGPQAADMMSRFRFMMGDQADPLIGRILQENLNRNIQQLKPTVGGTGSFLSPSLKGGFAGAALGLGETILQPQLWAANPAAIMTALAGWGLGKFYNAKEVNVAAKTLELVMDPSKAAELARLAASDPNARSFLEKTSMVLARSGAGVSAGQGQPQAQAHGGRINRASGGRLTGVTTAAMLVAAAERAKKGHGKATEPLLNQPDEAITRALAIANQHS